MRSLLLLAAGLLACAGFSPAQASNFSVSPIRLELESGQGASSLKVANESEEAKLLQVTVLRWTRENGNDVYAAETGAEAPIVTPPIFRLAPGASQIVRIGFVKPLPAAENERAWRVFVEEVPQPAANPAAVAGSVALRLRISLPLLLLPSSVRHRLEWSGGVIAGGPVRLSVINSGTVSERLDALSLVAADGRALGRASGPIYIFPGEQRQLEITPDAPVEAGAAKLLLQGTPQPLDAELTLRAR